MRTRPSAPRAVHIVALTCAFALATLSLTACKGRSDAGEVALDTAAPPAATVAPAVDTAPSVVAPTATKPTAAKPTVAKPSAAEPATAKPADAPAPPPAKTYPPFDPKASASTIGVFVYPKKEQPIEQQHFDENECFAWAKTNTGIDPTVPAAATEAAAAPVPKGGAVKGAAKGAVAGVAIGAAAGDAGKGAAIGAAAGGVAGRRGQKQTEKAAATDAQQQSATAEVQRKKKFSDAFTVCMDGRGYSVK